MRCLVSLSSSGGVRVIKDALCNTDFPSLTYTSSIYFPVEAPNARTAQLFVPYIVMTQSQRPSCWFVFAAILCLAATATIEFLTAKDLHSAYSLSDKNESDLHKVASLVALIGGIIHAVLGLLTLTFGWRFDSCCQKFCTFFSCALIAVNLFSTIAVFFECMVGGAQDKWYTWVGLVAGLASTLVSGLHAWRLSNVKKSDYWDDFECYC